MNVRPPSWPDRFLAFYCNPELLEEIQGDVHELYFERVKNNGKRSADLKYVWDILRFFRWSNIRRPENDYLPGGIGGRWNMNFKMSVRNAQKNRLIFAIKVIGLSACFAFALLLMAFIVSEFTFDTFHVNHDRIYRIESKVIFRDRTTNFAVTPLPIGEALTEDIPEIENYFRFIYEDKPVFRRRQAIFNDEVTLAADSNFLKILTFDFLQGDQYALNGPDRIVLTQKLASKVFADEDPIGQTIEFGDGFLLEVTAVIKDVPANSHLSFDALISWQTFERDDAWSNLNAYSYILLKPGATIEEVRGKIPSVMEAYTELIARDYDAVFEPFFEKITDIHFSVVKEEDIAQKRSKSNLMILTSVVGLLLITGLINYLNLTLAELTANSKKIGILKVFGGLAEGHHRILLTEILITLIVVLPLSVILCYAGIVLANEHLAIRINGQVFFGHIIAGVFFGFILLLIISTYANSLVLSRTNHLFNTITSKRGSGLSTRKFLVAAQLSFSVIMIALIIIMVDQFNFIHNADKGFEDSNTLVIKLRSGELMRTESFMESIRKISGINEVGNSSYYPGVIETKYVFQVETEGGMEQKLIPMMFCSYNYLNLLHVKLVSGRGFDIDRPQDESTAFIVNETAAKQFGWRNGVGMSIDGPITGHNEAYRRGEVIGVIKDFNFATLHHKIEPLIIFPSEENWGTQFIYVKTDAIPPADLVSFIANEFQLQWPELPFEWEYLDAKYLSLYEKDYEVKNIFETGLIISILIASAGIFSISALLVTIRTKEMGIRKIAGANSLQLFLIHTKSFLQVLIIALIVSLPIIWYLSEKWLQTFAYHINLSVWHFIIPGIIALVITIITSGYHGVRSALVNPVDILKHE